MMVVIVIVLMVMMVVVMIVVMMVVIIIIVMFMVIVMTHVWGHDTRQADRIMWMVVAVTAAIVSRGRSREQCNCAETR